jgi:hypothetical protein
LIFALSLGLDKQPSRRREMKKFRAFGDLATAIGRKSAAASRPSAPVRPKNLPFPIAISTFEACPRRRRVVLGSGKLRAAGLSTAPRRRPSGAPPASALLDVEAPHDQPRPRPRAARSQQSPCPRAAAPWRVFASDCSRGEARLRPRRPFFNAGLAIRGRKREEWEDGDE